MENVFTEGENIEKKKKAAKVLCVTCCRKVSHEAYLLTSGALVTTLKGL